MPETVLYLEYISTEKDGAIRVDLASQGVTASSIAGNAILRIKKEASKDAYYAFAEAKGARKYLVARDSWDNTTLEQRDCQVETGKSTSDNNAALWRLKKLDESSEYFGISPRVEYNGEYYDPFYVFFPYSFYSSGMKAYCITSTPKTADGKAYAVYQEVLVRL